MKALKKRREKNAKLKAAKKTRGHRLAVSPASVNPHAPVVDLNAFAPHLRKATTHKGRKILQARLPQVHEGNKRSLLLRGNRVSNAVQTLLADLHTMRKPDSVQLARRQDCSCHIFEDTTDIEYLCRKNDAAIFCMGSSSKKRPFRLIFGRTFDHELLDMYEFAVSDYFSMSQFSGIPLPITGSKPLVLCQGSCFETSETLQKVKNILCDFFSGPKVSKICLKGLEHVICLSATNSDPKDESNGHRILFRHFRIEFKRAIESPALPRVELVEIGPSFTLRLDRHRLPEADRFKQSTRVAKSDLEKKKKNFSRSNLGDAVARVHIGQQTTNRIYTPHYHLKNKKLRKETMEK